MTEHLGYPFSAPITLASSAKCRSSRKGKRDIKLLMSAIFSKKSLDQRKMLQHSFLISHITGQWIEMKQLEFFTCF